MLPTMMSLQAQQCPVVDQGQEGSCTANAGAGFLGFLELQKVARADFKPLSRQFIYYNERKIEGNIHDDSGASLRDCMKAIYAWGAPFEIDWPYEEDMFNQPNHKAYTTAEAHKISWFVRLESLDDMKHCIAGGHPFVYGFTVYDSFESDDVARTGIVPMPSRSESVLGGHAVLAVGYDDATQTVLTKNSWGSQWGQDGYFQMPYAYLENSNLTSDIWTIKR